MKIAHIFAYLGDGGAEECAILLADQAKKDGHEAVFIIDRFSELALSRLIGKYHIKPIFLRMRSSFDPFEVMLSAIGLKRIIKSEGIDILHSHMLREQSLGVIAKKMGADFKLLRTFHRFDQFNWKMRPLMAIYNKFTDAFIAISTGMADYLKSNGLVDKVSLINNGVPAVAVAKHGHALGFIGRLADEKGILQFIDANREMLRDTKLVVAGDGPYAVAIKRLVSDNNLNVELLGQIDDKADFYKKISVLVVSSKTEVMPLVVLEAYSCGLPVVGFEIDGLKTLVGNSNGKLVQYPNYEQLGKTALQVLGDSKSFANANIDKYSERYSVEKMWHDTVKLYKSLTNK